MVGFVPQLKSWRFVRLLTRLSWASLIKLARNGGFMINGLTSKERRRLQGFTKETWTFTHPGRGGRRKAKELVFPPLTRKFQEGYELTADGWKVIKQAEDAAMLADELR